jgi:mycothiol system anti-sigma-R factor
MDCIKAAKLLFEFLDEELDGFCCTELKEHLDICISCRCHFEFEKSMMFFISKSETKTKAPKRLKNTIKKRISKL